MKSLKSGHSLFRSLFVVIVLGVLACLMASLLYGDAEITPEELQAMQAKADAAYKTVYFEKVKGGSRTEVEVSELIAQLKEDGVNKYKLAKYKFTIKNGKVLVEAAHEEKVVEEK